ETPVPGFQQLRDPAGGSLSPRDDGEHAADRADHASQKSVAPEEGPDLVARFLDAHEMQSPRGGFAGGPANPEDAEIPLARERPRRLPHAVRVGPPGNLRHEEGVA